MLEKATVEPTAVGLYCDGASFRRMMTPDNG
jgi:hypothetical protein